MLGWAPMTACGSLCAGETPSRPLDGLIYRLRSKLGLNAARGLRLQAVYGRATLEMSNDTEAALAAQT